MGWSDEISGVVIDAAFWWIGVEDPGTPVEKVGDLSLEVSSKLRTLAILELIEQHPATAAGGIRLRVLDGTHHAARLRRQHQPRSVTADDRLALLGHVLRHEDHRLQPEARRPVRHQSP